MQQACARARVCPCPRVRFVLSAGKAAAGDRRDGDGGCEQKHVLPRAHYVPISHPLSTPRSSGKPPRTSESFAGSQGPGN